MHPLEKKTVALGTSIRRTILVLSVIAVPDNRREADYTHILTHPVDYIAGTWGFSKRIGLSAQGERKVAQKDGGQVSAPAGIPVFDRGKAVTEDYQVPCPFHFPDFAIALVG